MYLSRLLALLSSLFLFLLLPLTTARLRPLLGINCRGSGRCVTLGKPWPSIPYMRHQLFDAVRLSSQYSPLPDGNLTMYHKDQQIVCQYGLHHDVDKHHGICLFLQGNVPEAGIPLFTIIEKLAQLDAHGCTTCGSIPLGENNDPLELGQLTVNFVGRMFCPKRARCYCLTPKRSDGLIECDDMKPSEWRTTPNGWEIWQHEGADSMWWTVHGDDAGDKYHEIWDPKGRVSLGREDPY